MTGRGPGPGLHATLNREQTNGDGGGAPRGPGQSRLTLGWADHKREIGYLPTQSLVPSTMSAGQPLGPGERRLLGHLMEMEMEIQVL